MAPFAPSKDTTPTREDVERCRKETENLLRKHKLQRKLCKAYLSAYEEEWSAARDAQVHRGYKAKTDLQDRLDSQLRRYAQTSCQQLCHRVITGFPREVRDMVYSAMLDRGYSFKNVIQLSRAAHERHLGPLSTSAAAFPPLVCRLGIPEEKNEHCWDRKFCGDAFLKELVEMCYREKTFEFRQQDLYLLSTFLGQGLLLPEVPDLNTVAPTQQVGRLKLCIRPTGNGWKFTLKTLQGLLKLKRKAKIEVIIDTPLTIVNGEGDIDRVIASYQQLFPLFAAIKERGHTVRLLFGVVLVRAEALTVRTTIEWADVAQKKLNDGFASTKPQIKAKIKATSRGRIGSSKPPAVASARGRSSRSIRPGPATLTRPKSDLVSGRDLGLPSTDDVL